MDQEEFYENLAKREKRDVILICDRGIMDNFAYCSKDNKRKILEDNEWSYNYVCN